MTKLRLSQSAKDAVHKYMTMFREDLPNRSLVPCLMWVARSSYRPDPHLGFGAYERHQVEHLIEDVEGIEIVFVMTEAERNAIGSRTIDYSDGQFFVSEEGAV